MFSIGASWGGTRSLIGFYPASLQKAREFSPTQDALVRVAIGVEDPQLLINDLKMPFWPGSLHSKTIE